MCVERRVLDQIEPFVVVVEERAPIIDHNSNLRRRVGVLGMVVRAKPLNEWIDLYGNDRVNVVAERGGYVVSCAGAQDQRALGVRDSEWEVVVGLETLHVRPHLRGDGER